MNNMSIKNFSRVCDEKGIKIIETTKNLADKSKAKFYVVKTFGCGHTTDPEQIDYNEWIRIAEEGYGTDLEGYSYYPYVMNKDNNFFVAYNEHWSDSDHYQVGRHCPNCIRDDKWGEEQLNTFLKGEWVIKDRWLMSRLFGKKIIYKNVYSCGCEEIVEERVIGMKEFIETYDPDDPFYMQNRVYIRSDADGNVIEQTDIDYKCDECQKEEYEEMIDEAIKQSNNIDPMYNEYQWVHCLDAYRGHGLNDIVKHANKLFMSNEFELCCSDVDWMCGTVGVVVEGTVTGVFDYDCCSEIDKKTGKRYATRADFIGDDIDKMYEDNNDYHEIWVKNFNVITFVIREDAEVKVRKLARKLAKKYKKPLCMNIDGYKVIMDDNDGMDYEFEDLEDDEEVVVPNVAAEALNRIKINLSEWY